MELAAGVPEGSALEPIRPQVHHDRSRGHEKLTRDPAHALARFGHAAFRPGQREVVEAVLQGRDVLAVMPTGSGKSLGYQLPALCLPGTTLVVSPLVALMKDQVDELSRRGVPAAAIHSLATSDERREALRAARSGALKLLYVAPERFQYEGFDRLLGELSIARFAVDEAHCVSEWGHDFRPDYRLLKEAARRCRRADGEGRPPIVAVTATATPEVREDVATLLGLEEPAVFVAGFDRPNIRLSVRPVSGPREKRAVLPSLVGDHRALVYAATRRSAEAAAAALAAAGVEAAAYHAGLDDDTRRTVQDAFAEGSLRAVAATNAFGMGIDRPDIARVVHWELPGSLEAYYQEVGRAGRDGRAAEAVLLWNAGDIRTREFLLSREDEDDPRANAHLPGRESSRRERAPLDPAARARRRELDKKKLRRMIDYAQSAACLKGTILRYFGDPAAPERCGNCGTCARSRAVDADELLLIRKVLSGVARAGERWGRRKVAAMLAGELEGLPASLTSLSTTGLLEEVGAKRVERWLDASVAAGLLRETDDDYRTLSLTKDGRDVMAGRASAVTLTPPDAEPARRGRERGRRSETAMLVADAKPDPRAERVLDRLKEWRRSEASARGIPAYTVFHDTTLASLAVLRPRSLDALSRVSGVGPAKLERYGPALLEILAKEA